MKIIKKCILLLCLFLLGIVGVIGTAGYMEYKEAIEEKPIETLVNEIQSQKQYTKIEDIQKDLLDATVAIEDHRFYNHGGIDLIATVRAMVFNLMSDSIVGGGSTITQQLAKNMYFTYQPSYIRKVSELFVAFDLERLYSKDEILELYVNVINYGDQHIGIQQASLGYFGVEPKDLTYDQATLLAGLPQSPANYQLSNHKENALIRQKQVQEALEDYRN